MEKLQQVKKNLLSPEKAASFIPVFISSVLSVIVIIFFVLPQYSKSTKVSFELEGLIKKKNELDKLKSQYKIINEKFDKLNKEKLSIIELITGTSKLETLLAKLGEIGNNNNIKFTTITPKKIIKSQEDTSKNKVKKIKNNKKAKNQPNLKDDPLFVEGIKKYEFNFSFKTDFVNLLAFLRELEFQDNVILIDDINIKSKGQIDSKKEIKDSTESLEVDMSIVFYGKI